MSQTDDWTGPRDGPFRGERLTRCPIHSGWWRPSQPCPACALAARVMALEAQLAAAKTGQDRRCQECKQKPVEGRVER
jgi:hypothetical protein